MAAASSEIDAGRILQGRYTLLAKLGDHAGDVFTAQRASDGRVVVVRRWRAPAPQVANAFVERARAALVVRHPVLASVEACGQELDRTCFIVSEHVQGRRLDDWADKVGIPSFANVIEVGRKLCAGLLAAQQGGLTHDALHPRNVVVAQRSEGPAQPLQVKLLDLGVPAFVRPRVPHALAAQFMAPEQLAAVLGTASPTGVVADGAMNVYSLGCLLYYLCTGGAPFQCSTIDELREAHATGKLVPAVRINPKLPAQLDALIVRTLAISPRERI
ncbi:MAG TPA: protein kinase, partial [Polyangiales bacterium]|nr:protein kinase [Polyangiales bacterium]